MRMIQLLLHKRYSFILRVVFQDYHLLKYLNNITILYILLYGKFRTLAVIMVTLTLMC